MSLENAPDDVKLAVDLIVLLEENQIPARTVLGRKSDPSPHRAARAGYCKTRL